MLKWFAKHPMYSWQWYHWLAYYCLLLGTLIAIDWLMGLFNQRSLSRLGSVKQDCGFVSLFTLFMYLSAHIIASFSQNRPPNP